MFLRNTLLILAAAVLLADARLQEALGLSVGQARQVQEIQQKHQRPYAAKREERNREMRKLRRVHIANDSAQIAGQEKIAKRLHEEMMAIQHAEDAEIRRLLTPEQSRKFDAYLEPRREMVGSSRDDKAFTGR